MLAPFAACWLILCISAALSAPIAASKALYVPLFGDFAQIFQYYASVTVGGQLFNVTVDTGSSDFLVPDRNCQGCAGAPATWYDSQKSETSKIVECSATQKLKCTVCRAGSRQCGYTMQYVGVGLKAWVFQDVASLGTAKATATFGATYNVSFSTDDAIPFIGTRAKAQVAPPLFVQKKAALRNELLARSSDSSMIYPEGMFGMCWKQINALGTTPLFDDFVAQGQVPADIFSLCLHEQGGTLALGAIPNWVATPSKILWAALTKHEFYNVEFLDVQLNDQSIGIPATVYNEKDAIVDSGTVMPTLPEPAWEKFKAVLLHNCSRSHLHGICDVPTNETLLDGICYKITPDQRAQFPIITFVLRGAATGSKTAIPYPPTQYLQPQYFCQNPGEVAWGIDKDPQFSIIGAEMLQGYTTIFDRASMRVGFSPEVC